MKRTEWFQYVGEEDLNTKASYHTAILYCPKCNTLYKTKACGFRTIFPFFGYHPTDGNVEIAIECSMNICECNVQLERVTTIEKLEELIP